MKKLIALLLCVCMVLSFAACAKTETAPEETNAHEATETPAANETPAGTETPAAAESSDSVNVSGLEPGALPIVPEGQEVTLTLGVRQQAQTEDYENNEFTQWLEEQTGVNLEFVYFSSDSDEAQQQLSLMVAGGEKLPDIMIRSAGKGISAVNEYGEDGYYIDLNPYYDAGLAYYWTKAAERAESTVPGYMDTALSCAVDANDGSRYGYPYSEISNGNDVTANHAWINVEWLNKLGLEFPKTIDELHDVLTAFVNDDPNGNGQKDEIGIISALTRYRADIFQYLINAYVFCNDTYLYNSTDGKIWLPYTTDEYREALKTLNQWYEEGLISPLTFTISDNAEVKPIWTPDDNVAIVGVVGGHASLFTQADNETFFEYEHMWPLAGATELGGYANTMAPNLEYTSAISADCENPEVAFRFLDFLSSDEAMLRCRYGVEGREWTWATEGMTTLQGDQADIDLLDESMWSEQNSVLWHEINPGLLDYSHLYEAFHDDGSFSSRKAVRAIQCRTRTLEGTIPAEQVTNLVYTADEQAVISEYQQLFKDYMRAARSQFISGELDIEDDNAWNAYLDACEQQGASKLIEAAQAAWSRQNG